VVGSRSGDRIDPVTARLLGRGLHLLDAVGQRPLANVADVLEALRRVPVGQHGELGRDLGGPPVQDVQRPTR